MAGKRNRQRQARRRAEALAADDVERGEEAAILARNYPAELAAAGVAPDDADGVLAWWGEQRSEAHPCTGEPAQRSIDLLRDFLLAAGPVLEVPAMSEASRLAQMPLATSYQAAQSWLCWIGKQQAAGADYPVDVVDALMWDGLEALGSPDRLLAGVTEESAERAMTLAFETDFQGAPLYCDLVHTTLGGGAAFASAWTACLAVYLGLVIDLGEVEGRSLVRRWHGKATEAHERAEGLARVAGWDVDEADRIIRDQARAFLRVGQPGSRTGPMGGDSVMSVLMFGFSAAWIIPAFVSAGIPAGDVMSAFFNRCHAWFVAAQSLTAAVTPEAVGGPRGRSGPWR